MLLCGCKLKKGKSETMETIIAVIVVWIVASVPVGIVFGAFLSLGSRTSENATIIQMPVQEYAESKTRRGA